MGLGVDELRKGPIISSGSLLALLWAVVRLTRNPAPLGPGLAERREVPSAAPAEPPNEECRGIL
jgi:hypothetical protein